MALTQVNGGMLDSVAQQVGFRNRIINGAMMIDQRNAGASVTPAAGNTYVTDRFFISASQASKISAQQNAGAVTPPAGFSNYLGITSLSSYSVNSADYFQLVQVIEGFNVADLAWGTASASPATLSFWVRSSLTGTFGGSLATTKTSIWCLPFSYTISSANTWTYVTVPVPAATSSAVNTDNTAGVYVRFGLGMGSGSSGGTSGTWVNANYNTPTGATSVVGTNGATFYITGVQLEKGSTATSFDYRPYGTELTLCQRYYYRVTADIRQANGYARSTTQAEGLVQLPVTMRTAPTALEQTGTATDYTVINQATATTCSSVPVFIAGSTSCVQVRYTVASGLTAGNGLFIAGNTTAAYLGWSAEL